MSQRQIVDAFLARAKREGYVSRAVYKLQQVAEQYPLLPRPGQSRIKSPFGEGVALGTLDSFKGTQRKNLGATVLELGNSPGSWTQWLFRNWEDRLDDGVYCGVDIQPLSSVVAQSFGTQEMRQRRPVELSRSDPAYRSRHLLPVYQLKRSVYSLIDPEENVYRPDPILEAMMEKAVRSTKDIKIAARQQAYLDFEEDLAFLFGTCKFDVILSDMAPKVSGIAEHDKIASAGLCLQVLRTARAAGNPAGHSIVMKCLLGSAGADLVRYLRRGAKTGSPAHRSHRREAWVNVVTPEATRHGSSETFIVLRNLRSHHLDEILDHLPPHLITLDAEAREAAAQLERQGLAQVTGSDPNSAV